MATEETMRSKCPACGAIGIAISDAMLRQAFEAVFPGHDPEGFSWREPVKIEFVRREEYGVPGPEEQLRGALLAACWRYAQESDVTLLQTLRALHATTEIIMFPKGGDQ